MPSVLSVRSAVRVSWLALLVVAVDVSALQAQRASGPLTLSLNWVANPRVNPIDQGSQVVHDLRGVASGRFKTFNGTVNLTFNVFDSRPLFQR